MGNFCISNQREQESQDIGIRENKKGERNTNSKVSMYFQNINSNYKSMLQEQQHHPESQIDENDLNFYLTTDKWYLDERFEDESQLLFDKLKFIKLYSNYEALQGYYAQNWENIIVEKPFGSEMQKTTKQIINFDLTGKRPALDNWRYVIRKGVPLSLIRDLIFNIVDLSYSKVKNYKNIRENIFLERSDRQIKIVPTFSFDNIGVRDNITVNILNEEGIDTVKRILWCLNATIEKLEYNPVIINCIANLLLFLSEGETYFAMKQLIDNSVYQFSLENKGVMRHLRWHFTINQDQYYIKAKSFVEFSCQKYTKFKDIILHLQEIKFKGFKRLYQKLTSKFFANVFSYSTVLRLFVIFLNEGVRVYDKIMFGMCMLLYPQIMQETNPSKIEEIFMQNELDKDIDSTELLFKLIHLKLVVFKKVFLKLEFLKGLQIINILIYYIDLDLNNSLKYQIISNLKLYGNGYLIVIK